MINKSASMNFNVGLKKTDNPKFNPITDVLAATKAVHQALKDAEKGYRQTLYEQAARIYEIAQILRTSQGST